MFENHQIFQLSREKKTGRGRPFGLKIYFPQNRPPTTKASKKASREALEVCLQIQAIDSPDV